MRTILCFARKAFRKNNTLKTKIALTTFLLAMFFIVTCISFMGSFIRNFIWGDERYDDHVNILLINTPDSFKDFSSDYEDYFEKEKLVIAPYDFINIYKEMDKNDAFAAVVFPDNFDSDILDPDKTPEIITYYQTDLFEHKEKFDSFLEYTINYDYQIYLSEKYSIESNSLNAPYEISEEPIDIVLHSYEDGMTAVVVPLLIFIATMYVSMCSGTNVIAGEKENGTFLGILMTPSKRSHIILGNFLGCFLASSIPGILFIALAKYAVPASPGIVEGPIPVILSLLLALSFAALVAALTLMLSTASNTTLSAQTMFLPIFLVFLLLSIKCIQNVGQAEYLDYILPIYGHFYGIGYLITNGAVSSEPVNFILPIILCIIVSILLTILILFITTKMLFMERFTTHSEGITKKQIRNSNRNIFTRIPVDFLFNQLMFPLITLSIFQLIAIIPTAIHYMADSSYSEFILSLKDVTTISEIFKATGEVLSIFLSSPIFLTAMGICYIFLILTYAIKIYFSEHEVKPFSSMGLAKRRALTNYLWGLLIGFLMLTFVVIFLLVTKSASISGIAFKSSNTLILILSIFMWTTQGAAEEVMFRGYMLKRVEKKCGRIFAIIFSSLLFAVLHGANIGFTMLAGINLFLVAVFFALLFYRTNSLWITCAAHTAWNFCQGTLYGLEVSGSTSSLAILNTTYLENAKAFITGGAFGPEGGLGVTLVSVIGIVILLLVQRKSYQKEG